MRSIFVKVTILSVFSMLAVLPRSGISAQDENDVLALDSVLLRAQVAADSGDYASAVSILERAKFDFPDSAKIRIALGDIFSYKEFFELAAAEYEAAEVITPDDVFLLYSLSDCYGKLNEYAKSIAALNRLLSISPDDTDAINDLAWMLYKTHRIDDGIELLDGAKERLGANRNFAMTLGTLYSERYDYENSKLNYTQAIEEALASDYKHFASIAWYNLSLLETAFYKNDEALRATNESIKLERRSSGLLARGELKLRRLEFASVFSDYKDAFSLDQTPLSRLDLAEACLLSGRLEESLSYVKEVAAQKKHPWMANFGIDPESLSMEVHDLYSRIYDALAEQERWRPKKDIFDAIGGFFAEWRYRIVSYIEELKRGKLARSVASAYEREGNDLYASLNYYSAFKRYPRVAEKYLQKAMAIETKAVPMAAASYKLELGKLNNNENLIGEAMVAFDIQWERDTIAESLVYLAKIKAAGGKREEARSALERLYALNRGAFRGNGLGLPVELTVSAEDPIPDLKTKARKIATRLSAANMELARPGEEKDFAYRLELILSDSELQLGLMDKKSGARLKSGRFLSDKTGDFDYQALAAFILKSLHDIDI